MSSVDRVNPAAPIFLASAVEPSADLLLAEILTALRAVRPDVAVHGIGGPRSVAAGLSLLPGAEPPRPAMGAAELLGHLRHIRHNRACLRAVLDAGIARADTLRRPALFLAVDAPDFHLPLGAHARARAVPSLGIVAPQVWAWRPGRARHIHRSYDRLLCLFAFEPELFTPHGLDARFVGHPAPGRLPPRAPEPGSLALMPGSRDAEIRRLWPDFRAVGLAHQQRGGSVLVGLAPGVRPDQLPGLPPGWAAVDSRAVLARAARALTTSGTGTLELALAGVPAIVAHRVSPLTYWIGRLLIHGVRHLALPNILLKRAVYEEYIQRFTPADLLAALDRAAPPPQQELARLTGPPGMPARCAAEIQDMLPPC